MCTVRIKCTAHFKDGKTWVFPLRKIQSSLYVKQIAAASDDQEFVSGNRWSSVEGELSPISFAAIEYPSIDRVWSYCDIRR